MEENERRDYVGFLQNLFSTEKILLAGIVVSGLGAIWGGLSQRNSFVFAAFLLLAFALIYLVFPRSWTMSLWLAGIYVVSVAGTLLITAWSKHSLVLAGVGVLCVLLGAYFSFLFLEHVKNYRDSSIGGEYVTLGLWSLVVAAFFLVSCISAYGIYLWFKGSSLLLYISGEVFLVLSIPYILTKTEAVGVSILMPHNIIHFGDERCPVCDALVTIETRKCPSCSSTRTFRWCPVCESYIVTCPGCRERTLWRESCSMCGSEMSNEALCKICRESAPVAQWDIEN